MLMVMACGSTETDPSDSEDASQAPVESCEVTAEHTMAEVCGNPNCTGSDICTDTTAPQISVTTPAISDSANYTLRGNIEHDGDLADVTYKLNGGGEESLSISQDKFEVSLTLQPGDNSIAILAVDASGNEGRFQMAIRFDRPSEKLHASFSASGTFEVSEPVHFDATATSFPHHQTAYFYWDFGDGSTGQGQQTNHVYATADVYIVTLRVRTDDGAESFHLDNIEIGSREMGATSGRVAGVVVAPDGSPIDAAQITLSETDLQALTTTSGSFSFDALPVDEPMVLAVSRPGYVTRSLRFEIDNQRNETFVRVVMQPTAEAQTGEDAAADTTFTGDSGESVQTSPDSLVDSNGDAVSGIFQVVITPLDVAQYAEQLPGSTIGIANDGSQIELQAAGAVHVAFYQDGQPLQVAPSRSILISIPMYLPLVAEGESIRAFALNDASGLWLEQPDASVQTNPQSPPETIATLEIHHAGWWLVAREASPSMSVSATCTLPTSSDDGASTDLDVGNTNATEDTFDAGAPASPETCWVEARAPGWSHNFGSLIGTTESFDAPAGEVCLRARSHGGLCQGELCVTGDRNDALSADIALNCLDDGVRIIEDNETIDNIALDADTPMVKFSFTGQAGDGVIFQMRQRSRKDLAGTIELYDSTGNLIASELFAQEQDQAVAAILPDDGQYFAAVLVNNDESGEVSTKLLFRSVLNVGDTASGTIDAGESVMYLVDAIDAELLNSVLTGDLGSNSNTTRFYWYDLLGARQTTASRALGIETGIIDTMGQRFHQVNLSRANVGSSSPANFEFVVAAMPRIPLATTFDTLGRSIVNAQIDTFGEHRFIEVDASAGDGLYVELRGVGDSPTESAHKLGLRIWYKGTGTTWNGEERLYILTADPGVIGAMDAWQERAPYDGTYVFEIYPYSFSDSQIELGQFELVVDRVRASTNITVGESSCPGATTRSYSAAMRAIKANGTVTICEGTYLSLTTGYISEPGVTLQGAGPKLSVLRYTQPVYRSDGGVALAINNTDITIQDLGITYWLPPEIRSDGGSIISDYYKYQTHGESAGTEISNVNLAIDSAHYRVNRGIQLRGPGVQGTSDIALENLTISGVNYGIEMQGDRLVLNDSTIDAFHTGVKWNYSDMSLGMPSSFTVNNCAIESGYDGVAIYGGANHVITNNTITGSRSQVASILDHPGESTSVISYNNLTVGSTGPSIAMTQKSQSDSDQRTIEIDSNHITTAVDEHPYFGALEIISQDPSSAFSVSGNSMYLDGAHAINFTTGSYTEFGGTIAFTNNVVDEIYARRTGFTIKVIDRFSHITLANNSFRSDPNTVTSEPYRALDISLDDPNFSGALPLTLRNNIFQGPTDNSYQPHTAVRLTTANATATLDSDYNLFNGFSSAYAGGLLTVGAHDIVDEDPLFSNAQLAVDPTSPAVDAGICTGAPTTDYAGASRPQGASCDIGANEQ